MCSKGCFTINGSQPYVLPSEWPLGFIPEQTMFVPDYSLYNLEAANVTSKYANWNSPTYSDKPVHCNKKCNKIPIDFRKYTMMKYANN